MLFSLALSAVDRPTLGPLDPVLNPHAEVGVMWAYTR